MKSGWSQTRPNGQPIEAGTFCWITDLEDGTHPIPTYGKTVEEVLQKLADQNANAQLALARRTAAPVAPPPAARVISPDQVMRATQDLDNPAKAGEAIATLVEAHTGVDLRQLALDRFAQLALNWQAATPEFFPHPGNKRLLASEAQILAGGELARVTRAHLDQAYHSLKAQGLLLEATAAPQNTPPPNPAFPDESQVQREPQRRFATGARSTSFQRPAPVSTRTPKYTEQQIRSMSTERTRELISSNDPDYQYSCDYWFGTQATA